MKRFQGESVREGPRIPPIALAGHRLAPEKHP